MPPPSSNPVPLDAPAPPPMPMSVLLARLSKLAWAHRWVALPAGLITVAIQFVVLAGLGAQGIAIDLVRKAATANAPDPHWPSFIRPPAEWSFLTQLIAVGSAILLCSLLNVWLRYAGRVADERFVQDCVVDLRTRLYAKLQRLSFTWFDTHDTGQVINRITGDTQSVRGFIQGVMIRSVIALITLVVFLAFMLKTHVGLTIACLSLVPVQVGAMLWYGRKTKPLFIEQNRLIDVLVKHLQESIAGVRVIRAFGQERQRLALFDKKSADARDQRIAIARDQGNFQPFSQACGEWTLAILLLYGGLLVLKGPAEGGIALGTLWVFRGLLGQLAAQSDAIIQIIAGGPEALAGAERVFRLLDEPITIGAATGSSGATGGSSASASSVPPTSRLGETGAALPLRGRVEFQIVTFSYPARSSQARDDGSHATGRLDRPALADISFTAEPGETIAIVGPTGSGKSTLLSLIARFHDPQSGTVRIDDADARDHDLRHLRSSIGFVFQEPFLFSNTIRNNIAYGRPNAADPEILAAAAAASASDVIAEAPNRLETIIGERGVSLSGGQRQRLTIARALLLRPPILILDDATGAVDAITESEIQNSLDDYIQGRTTFIVAHRLSTLRRADRIIVLEHGRIVDIGTHDELMNRPGHYRAAALIQLALDEDGPPSTAAKTERESGVFPDPSQGEGQGVGSDQPHASIVAFHTNNRPEGQK